MIFNLESISEYIKNIIFASQVTLLIALVSAISGLLLGVILALCKFSRIKLLKNFSNIYTDIFRGTPVILQLAIVWYLIFGSLPVSPLIAAFVTFSLNSAAYVSEIIRSGIQNIDKGQIEAAKSMGVSNKDITLDIIIPLSIRKTMPPLINEFVTLIKETSIVYLIGVKDIMYYVNRATSNTYRYFEPLIVAGICYYVLIKLVSYLGKKVEVKFNYDKNQ